MPIFTALVISDVWIGALIFVPSQWFLPKNTPILRIESQLTIFTVPRVKYTCEFNVRMFITFDFIL